MTAIPTAAEETVAAGRQSDWNDTMGDTGVHSHRVQLMSDTEWQDNAGKQWTMLWLW